MTNTVIAGGCRTLSENEIKIDELTTIPVSHIAISGVTGAGKTQLIGYLLIELLKRKSRLILIDPKYSDLYSLREYITDTYAQPTKVAACLRNVVEQMNKRYELHNSQWGKDYRDYGLMPVYVVIDEAASLLGTSFTDKKTREEIQSRLLELILRGRQAGFFLILASQRFSSEWIDTSLRAQFTSRFLLGETDKESFKMLFPMLDYNDIPYYNAEVGHGLVYVQGKNWTIPRPFTAPNMSDIDVTAEIAKLV